MRRAVLGMWTVGCSAGDAREGPGKEIWAGDQDKTLQGEGQVETTEEEPTQ